MLTATSALTRRTLLKSTAAAAGVAAGSGAIGGFPTIWAQNIKDVVLNHAGPPVTAIPLSPTQATKDLGFTVHMQATENAACSTGSFPSRSRWTVADAALTNLPYLIGRNVLQSVPLASSRTGTRRCPSSPRASILTDARSPQRGQRRSLCCRSTGPDAEKFGGEADRLAAPASPP